MQIKLKNGRKAKKRRIGEVRNENTEKVIFMRFA